MSDRYPTFPPETLSVTEVIKLAGCLPEFTVADIQWHMDKGSAAHHATALHDLGTLDESTVDPAIVGYLTAWKKFREDAKYTPVFIERPLLHSLYGYCGTLDRDGLDIKTGSPAPWHILQASSYRELMRDNGLSENISDGFTNVYLSEDGTYKVKIYSAKELRQGRTDFLTLLAAIRIKANYVCKR